MENDISKIPLKKKDVKNISLEDKAELDPGSTAQDAQSIAKGDHWDTVTIGQYFKTMRESQGIDLFQISKRTKINLTILKALEENRFQDLPSITYLRGFVKSYAKELHIPEQEILLLLAKSNPIPVQKSFIKTPILNSEIKNSTSFFGDGFHDKALRLIYARPKFTAIVAGSLALLIVIGAFVAGRIELLLIEQKQVNAPILTTSPSVLAPPAAQMPELQEVQEVQEVKEVTVASSTPATQSTVIPTSPSTLLENNQPNVQAKVETKVETKVEVEPVKTSTLESSPLTSKEEGLSKMNLPLVKLSSDAEEVKDRDILPENVYLASRNSNKQNFFITGHSGDSWIIYKVDNGAIKSYILRQGRRLFLSGQLIRIFVGNVGATKMFLNNKLVQPITQNGVKSMVFPEEKASSFYTPLFIRDNSGVFRATSEN